MSDGGTEHSYTVGDAVLVHVAPGVRVPGVIEDQREGQFQVSLAQPWTDETVAQTGDLWTDAGALEPAVGGDAAEEQALPSP